jgi:hypothetical protein
MNTQECEACKGKFTEDEMTGEDAYCHTLLCLPCFYACENCDERRIDHDNECGMCDGCNALFVYCSGKGCRHSVKVHDKSEMKEHNGKYYCSGCKVKLPKIVFTGKRRKRILPPVKA